MSKAAAFAGPRRSARIGGGGRGLVGVGHRGEDDASIVGLLEARGGEPASLLAASTPTSTTLSGGRKAALMMPERSRIHSSEESMASTSSEFGTTRRGAVAADPR
jgi:hypothetical protein